MNDKQTLESYETESKDGVKNLWIELLIFAAAAILLLSCLGSRTLWSSEGRWAEITREMFLSKDFFHPTIGGEPYFDKPLITYWAIAAIAAVTNRLDEFIIRLPSVIAALITLAGTMYLGSKLWSRKVGRLAGALLMTSYGFLMYSRVASAETENLAAIVLAVVWYWTRREKPDFVTFLVFYLIMFIGSHMKGLTAFVVPVVAILPDLIRGQRWKYLLRFSHLAALAIGIAVYLAPFIYAAKTNPQGYRESGLFLVFQENFIRYIKPYDHKGPIYLYLGVVPLLTAPWIPLFIGSIVASIKSWKTLKYNTRWLLTAIAMIFIFFTISGSRRNYYILPILPFCSILIAIYVAKYDIIVKNLIPDLKNQKYTLFVLAILEIIAGPIAVFVLIYKYKWEMPYIFGWSFLIIGAAAVLVMLAANNRRIKQKVEPIWAYVVTSAILLGGFFIWQYSILDTTRTEQPFALKMKTVAQDFQHDRVGFWQMNPDKQLFYMNWDLPVTMINGDNNEEAFEKLKEFIDNDKSGLIIAQGRHLSEEVLSLLPGEPDYIEENRTWDSKSRIDKRKLKAWIIDPNENKIVRNANDEE